MDKSFVDGIPQDEDNMAVVKAIIQMSSSLEINSLAEGIETAEQWHYLRDQGCHYGQGYYFSRPVPANEIETLWCNLSGRLDPNSKQVKTS
ncbi:MAG: EAL domain-containing protein [Gammaproteobacteria bacterium]|nr:EAL domain-containing protein [Gammaproteobacteria bacterium]